MKKIISVLLALLTALSVMSMCITTASASWSSDYSLTGDCAYDIVSVALAQRYKGRSDLGYSDAWCARFVSDCANKVGASDAIPYNAGVNTLRSLVLTAGGYSVSNTERQRGDLIFYYCSTCGRYMHVGLVVDSTYTIEGNYNNAVTLVSGYFTDEIGHSCSKTFVRPNYKSTSAPTYATISANGNSFAIGETISFSFSSDFATGYTIGIDRCDENGYYIERIITQDVSSTFDISSLSYGYYSAYVTAWNNNGGIDSNRISFMVDSVGHYISLGGYLRGTFLTFRDWKHLRNDPDSNNVYIYENTGNADCVWRLSQEADGSYTIRSEYDGKALTVFGSENGSNVGTANYTGDSSQKWYIYSGKNGGYYLRPKCANKVLDLYNNCIDYGTNIQSFNFHGGDSQEFRFYVGSEVLLAATQLTVESNYPSVKFKWNDVAGESFFRLRVYNKNNELQFEKWEIAETKFELSDLPDGEYYAIVHSYNYWTGYDSNAVTFTVKTPTYNVLFCAPNSSCSVNSKTITYGSTYGELPVPTRKGYAFKGWFTSESGGTQITSDTQVTITEDQTLYAHWEHDTFIVSENATVTVSNTNKLIYGENLLCMSEYDLLDLFENDNASVIMESSRISTGTTINLIDDSDEIYDTLTVVIFGDTNCDGWYDGADAILVNCLLNGLLTHEQVGEAVWAAADCNHDGVIDAFDVALLEKAGLLLSQIDQSKSESELLESDAYIEYQSLIDQSPDLTDSEPEVTPDPEPETEPTILEQIVSFIKQAVEFILSFVKRLYK